MAFNGQNKNRHPVFQTAACTERLWCKTNYPEHGSGSGFLHFFLLSVGMIQCNMVSSSWSECQQKNPPVGGFLRSRSCFCSGKQKRPQTQVWFCFFTFLLNRFIITTFHPASLLRPSHCTTTCPYPSTGCHRQCLLYMLPNPRRVNPGL